jgi:diguanylate cyclase (GGDEF)-like protein
LPGAIADLEKARSAQPPGSVSDTCMLIVRGLLEYRQNRSDLAIATLSHAYTAATALPTPVHVAAASTLSLLMRSMGDYPEALTLNQEEIDWASSRGAAMSLSVARFMRGQILKLEGGYDSAISEYTQARKLSVQLNDSQGIAYADLRICDSHIALNALAPARAECENALHLFSASQSADMVKETRALVARIDLKEGRPERALAALNAVLDNQGADLAPLHVADLYETRARANADLHNYRDAYDDLRVYVERYTATNDAERHRQAAALRARFETDREVARNETLKHELTESQERSNRQARELRLNTLVGAASVCVIALLIYFLFTNLRYRKQLTRLAREDSLTGLPNRRRIAELASAAVQEAKATGEPFAVALIDMDHFKIINDRCGHATGDFVLKEFARAGAEALRPTDTLGRWGGEEFLLLMPGATVEVAMANLDRLRTWVSGIRLPLSGVGLRVSLSAGLVAFDANAKSLDDMVARADAALYVAKNEGRDRVRIADLTRITGTHSARRASRS